MTDSVRAFQVGDLVRLRSGGPLMTVGKIQAQVPQPDEWSVLCHWFNVGQVEQWWFAPPELRWEDNFAWQQTEPAKVVSADEGRLTRAIKANAVALATMENPALPHTITFEELQRGERSEVTGAVVRPIDPVTDTEEEFRP